MKTSSIVPLVLVILLGIAYPSRAAEPLCGGYSETSITNTEVVAAAQFAVKAQAAKPDQKSAISLVEIRAAQQQVVAGMNYKLRLKVKLDGTLKEAEAVVWWQAWNKDEPYRLTSWKWK